MGEIRRTLMDEAAQSGFHAPVFSRNFSHRMRLDAACLALASRRHPSP